MNGWHGDLREGDRVLVPHRGAAGTITGFGATLAEGVTVRLDDGAVIGCEWEQFEPLTLAAEALLRREARRRELDKLSKARLCGMYRRGVPSPGGGAGRYAGGMYPPEKWTKDEVLTSILDIECPRPSVCYCQNLAGDCDGDHTAAPLPEVQR